MRNNVARGGAVWTRSGARKDKRRGSGLGPRNIKIAVLQKDYDNDKILMALVSMTSPPTLFVAK